MWFLWPVPIYLVVAAVFVLVLSKGRRLFPGTLTSQRSFWCPFRDTNVNVDFKESVWDGDLADVSGCTAFSPAQDVQCEKSCLLLRKLPTVKPEVAPSMIADLRGTRPSIGSV